MAHANHPTKVATEMNRPISVGLVSRSIDGSSVGSGFPPSSQSRVGTPTKTKTIKARDPSPLSSRILSSWSSVRWADSLQ